MKIQLLEPVSLFNDYCEMLTDPMLLSFNLTSLKAELGLINF